MNSLLLTFCIAGIFILLMQLILLFLISNYIEQRFGSIVRGGRNPTPPKHRKANPSIVGSLGRGLGGGKKGIPPGPDRPQPRP